MFSPKCMWNDIKNKIKQGKHVPVTLTQDFREHLVNVTESGIDDYPLIYRAYCWIMEFYDTISESVSLSIH